jgi:mono/diheme cytochrome c family protein
MALIVRKRMPLLSHERQGVALAAMICLLGCRGQSSTEPPVRVIKDMFHQPRATPLSQIGQRAYPRGAGAFVEGVVALEQALDMESYSTGKSGRSFVTQIPLPIDAAVIARGSERFGVYCSPCHDATGTANGIIAQRGFPSPIDLASPGTRQMPDGQLLQVIANGIRNMPGLGEQIQTRDRWSIVAWVRVLQRSRNATLTDVEEARVSSILPEQSSP